MGLESTIICVDNSEYMRNGDYLPTRLQAQQDAVNTICRFKLRSNPENNVGLITLSNNAEIVTTLTSDVGKILTSLHHVQPGGLMNLLTGLRIAHLALKHRGSRAHRMHVVAFVGSPLSADEKEIVRVGKKLKKESVILNIVNFGETDVNTKMLELLISTVNGKDSTSSHLVTVPAPCAHLADALLTSPVMASEDGGPGAASQFASGSAFEFGVDPNEDPELALALRVSMEEQRQRQQEEERRTTGDAPAPAAGDEAAVSAALSSSADSAVPVAAAPASATAAGGATSEEEMLQQALKMSLEAGAAAAAAAAAAGGSAAAVPVAAPDFATMSEEEQIAYAMQISMQDCEPMEIDTKAPEKASAASGGGGSTEDLSSVMADAAFLEGVLNKLPGVNPNSDVVKQAIDSYTGASSSDSKDDDKKKKKKHEDTDKGSSS
ncbi:26S proteasome non-ATPase regulatory subunit 4 [Hyalella azteca]|uniref:26S proteasome non-ATPase regulatory subunit 4 n=1 Tax=Hyalella azteca TaxID=294128 RepID=A0A8B7NM37_HYAAZ|nr:26S proteasome non-ATPase regulatory subunit 4 [Hyalella azteca]